MRVQVDVKAELPVVKGPGATRLLEVAVVLLDNHTMKGRSASTPDTKVRFTVKHPGTDTTSRITVKITSISLTRSMNRLFYYFEGIAAHGVKVWGYYSLSVSGSFIKEAIED